MDSKILLVSYYWYPFNNSGSFRWLHFSKYIKIDTLITSKYPYNSFIDNTIPKGRVKIISKFFKLPAVLWGIFIAPIVLVYSMFFDKIIFTSPPESLIFVSWLCQLFGKKVYLDLRDQIDRESQRNKWLVPIYKFFYKRIKNVCVTMQFFDPSKVVIRHGYINLNKKANHKKKYYFDSSYSYIYSDFINNLEYGYGINFKNEFKNYTSSLIPTLIKFNLPIIGNLHPECFSFKPTSWKIQSQKMKRFLNG